MPGRRRDAQHIATTERHIQALALRKQGQTYRDIGAALGIDHSTAVRDVQLALTELNGQLTAEAQSLRAMEAARLDALQAAIWPQAEAGNLRAIDRVIAIMERRARLLGLDASAALPSGALYELPNAERLARLAALYERAGARRAGSAIIDVTPELDGVAS